MPDPVTMSKDEAVATLDTVLTQIGTWQQVLPAVQAAILTAGVPVVPEVPEQPEVPEVPDPEIEYTPVKAGFTWDAGDGQAPALVQFTSTATGDVAKIEWDFGNGNVSPEANPAFRYLNPGRKPVIQRVYGLDGSVDTAAAEFSLKARPTPKPTLFDLPHLMRSDFTAADNLTWRKDQDKIAACFKFIDVEGAVWGASEGWWTRNAANIAVSRPRPDAKPALRIVYPERTKAYDLGGGGNIMIMAGSKTTPTDQTGYKRFAISFKIYPDQGFANAWPFDDSVDPDGLKGVPFKMSGLGGGPINGTVGNGNLWNDGQGPAEEKGQWRDDGKPGIRRGFSYRLQGTGRWDKGVGCLKPIWGCGDPRTDRNDHPDKKKREWGKVHYGLMQPAFQRIDVKRGEYNLVEMYFEANTPGKNDGTIIYMINGQVIHEMHDMMHRQFYQALAHSLWICTFFGGNAQTNQKAGSPRLNTMWWDDFVFAGAN